MAATSPLDSLSPSDGTPTPYRLDTRAVLIPERVDTATLVMIRASIQPRRGWWQFELRPWHYWTAITSAAVIAVAFVALLLALGGHR